jgi:membrane protease YdiL (CAAX protease family)
MVEEPVTPKKHSATSLAFFFSLAFLIMISLSFLGVLGIVDSQSPLFLILFVIGSWGPTLAAVITVGFSEGWSKAGMLFAGWGRWKVGFVWYLVALSPIAVAFGAAAIYLLLGGKPPGAQQTVTAPVLVMFLAMNILTGASGEEPGWRAFATPRLQKHVNALITSLILGALWALWHLPLWFVPGTPQKGMPYFPFAFGAIFYTVVATWAYNNSKGSLVIASLLHLFFNLSLGVVVGFLGLVTVDYFLWIVAGLYFFYALLVIVFAGPKHLTRRIEQYRTFVKSIDS